MDFLKFVDLFNLSLNRHLFFNIYKILSYLNKVTEIDIEMLNKHFEAKIEKDTYNECLKFCYDKKLITNTLMHDFQNKPKNLLCKTHIIVKILPKGKNYYNNYKICFIMLAIFITFVIYKLIS